MQRPARGPRGWDGPPWAPAGSGPPSWLPGLPLAVVAAAVQLGGSFGRAHAQGVSIGWGGVALLLAGPLALVLLARLPLVPLGVSIVAALGYVATGHPVGPVFAAPLAALLLEGFRRRRERLVALREERRRRRDSARADERMAMARDLHDALGHSLTLINVQAGAALHTFDRDPEAARAVLGTVKAESHRALTEVRRVLDAVRDPATAARTTPGPGLAGVADLVAADPGFAWTVDGDPRVAGAGLPPAVDAAAYRVVQEAMTNVRRHSGARAARIGVVRGEDRLEVVVEDPGPQGGEVETGPTSGTGLVGMRERVERVGGALAAGARPGGGHRVAATFPLAGGEGT
ncbi:sensor histidine kinase [Phycicoccus flavus]|uniref:sensor histidine kinase n=1 Tax=Phycicoccus flavus TaxID=2502783 RepID=UPI000FEC0E0B|nr:sensor histidine kinase [Phycicoccus flavus]NHA69138.1 sensor histidine kinase [Phycicoccus flavus]